MGETENNELEQCGQALIAAILAIWESEVPEPEKSLAKAMAGEDRDTIVVISSRQDVVMSDYRQRNVFANSALWRPYWATFVPLAVIAKERLSHENGDTAVSFSQIKDMIIPELKAINKSHTYTPDENTVFVGYGAHFLEFLNGFADFCYGPQFTTATNGKRYFQLLTKGDGDDLSTEMLAGLENKAPPLSERANYRIEWRIFPEYHKGNQYCRLAFVKNDAPRWFPYCRTAKEAQEALADPEISKKYDEICKCQ